MHIVISTHIGLCLVAGAQPIVLNGGTNTVKSLQGEQIKTAGPECLAIQANGVVTGHPQESDEGENTFIVTVTDAGGRMDAAVMDVNVR